MTLYYICKYGDEYNKTLEERIKLNAFASKPVRWFTTREEAIERYLHVSGLKGIIDPTDEQLTHAIFEGSEGFRLSADPKTVNVGPSNIICCGDTNNGSWIML